METSGSTRSVVRNHWLAVGRNAAALALGIVAFALAAVAVPAFAAASVPSGDGGGLGSAGAAAAPLTGECTADPSDEQQDLDLSDSPETPFHRTGAKVTVYFENDNLSPAYWSRVQQAVAYWNQSPCLDGHAVSTCPTGANCVTIEAHDQAYLEEHYPDEEGWDDTDGSFEGEQSGGWRVGGLLLLNTTLMDNETANGSTATITHEIGHAYGLIHRNNVNDVMHAETDDNTNPQPDSIDYWNLLVIYGK